MNRRLLTVDFDGIGVRLTPEYSQQASRRSDATRGPMG
jgi:hypothetical protein